MNSGRTHYSTLGVSTNASPDEIRRAYRALARQHHPDQNLGSAAGVDRMPEVNEAYHVLSDPARRAMYDASLREPRARESTTSDEPVVGASRFGDHDEDYAIRLRELQRPINFPWRTIAVLGALAVAAVFVLAQFTDSGGEQPVDNIMRIGDCAEVLPDGRAGEVPCSPDGAGDLVVRALVPFEARCDVGLSQHQDRQGMGNVCLEQLP